MPGSRAGPFFEALCARSRPQFTNSEVRNLVAHLPELVAMVRTHEVRETVAAQRRKGHVVRFCQPGADLGSYVRDGHPALVIWELGPDAEVEIASMTLALLVISANVRLLIRMDVTRAAARQALAIARHLPEARVSLSGYDDLARDIMSACSEEGQPTAYPTIVKQVLETIPRRAVDIVAAASLAGYRHMKVAEFARVCGVPVRTLEWRLNTAQLMPARNLLGWILSLHSLWRLDILVWTSKQAATAAGFSSPDAWAQYIKHHAGDRPSYLLHKGGFHYLLGKFREALSVRHSAE